MTRSVVSQLIAICTIGAAVAIGATPAVASTASVSGGVLTVANGNFGPEDNEFLVSCSGGPTGATCTVQDAGATLFPGPNCTLVTATCTGVDRVVVNAGAGSDVVEVAATLGTANQLNGGDGDDVLHSGTGDDVLMGGDGTDAVSYARRAGGVTASVAAAAGGATGTLESDTFGEIETLIGGSGNDVLRGGAGADTVDGGPGSDVINGGPGSDTLIGGAGTDTLSYDDRSAGVTVVLNGTSGATAGSEIDTTSAFENALGGSGNDLITGDATANQLDGAGGDDTLIGGPGDDTLIGGTGTDRVSYADRTGAADGVTVDLGAGTGGASAGGEADAITSVENLTGGAGPDVLTGSAAVNDVAGLGGNDTIAVSDAVADTVSCGAGTDAAGGDERDTLGTGTPNDCEARDQPARATFSVDDPTATEGDGGNPDLTFTVSLSRAVLYPVSVDYAIAPGTAQTPGDYTANDALTGTLTFTPGTTERTVRVAVTDDDLNEPSETLTLTLSNPVEATISGATGTGTIVDDDGLPSLTVDDVSVAEDSGTATFTITASKSYPADVTGSVDTRNGSAAAGSDYTAITDGTFLIPSGSTSTTVAVPVLDDEIDEGTTAETFEVVLSDAANATLSDGSGTATITDDDPSVSIGDVAAAEGDSGTTVLSLPITLSRPTSRAISGKVDTADGTATAGSDYDAIAGGSFLVPAGATTATVDVTVRGDTTVEPDETFDVLLRAVNTSVADAGGRGTILNDDAPPPASGPAPGPAPAPAPGPAPAPAPAPAPPVVPVVSADPVELREGDSGTSPANFIVRLSQPTSQPVAVSYRTVEDTARDGTDYAGTAGALSFAPGETAKLVAVPVVGDTRAEADEVFGLVLGAPQNAALANPSVATATILDDDRVASSRRSRPKLSLSSTRYRDRRAPYSFRFRGRLTIPKGMSKARTCRRGRVTITVKRWNKRRVRSYNATLNSKCRYSRLVTLPRSTKRGALRVSARYAGSSQLLTATSKTRRFRGG